MLPSIRRSISIAFSSALMVFVTPVPQVQMMSAQHLCGVYRGVVENASDPLQRGRLELRVPQANIDGLWALAGQSGAPPAVGAQVWVMFEGGNPHYPVWFGAPPPGA
jgi:hypothetical protein